MSLSQSNCVMREEMNPLDLLAEVAVSCSDDEKCDKLQHCDDFMEPEAEFSKPSPIKIPEITKIISDNNNVAFTAVAELKELLGAAAKRNVIHHEPDDIRDKLLSEQLADHTSTKYQSASEDNEINVKEECRHTQNDVNDVKATIEDQSSEVDIKINGINISEMNTRPCVLQPSGQVGQPLIIPSAHHSSVITKDCKITSSSEHILTYKARKPVYVAGTTTTLPPTHSVAQQVSRLLSPNFKLTMTDNMPSILHSRRVSSLLIGNLGSATIRNSLSPTTIVHRPPIALKQRTAIRKYPNISINAIPWDYPLLDHDYCYQNYCDIVQASTKLMKERNAAKKSVAKQSKMEQKIADDALNDDGKPAKKKYRTKKVIAQELEAERRLSVEQRAKEGDEQAQIELNEIEKLEQQQQKGVIKLKKKCSRRRHSHLSAADIDSDEEALNEITDDVDYADPVVDHNPAFKDQFLYFGSKKYKSRRRHLNKQEDPYESFWRTGVLKNNNSSVDHQVTDAENISPASELSMDCGLSAHLMLNTSQEMNDVFDVLGISPCESQDTVYADDVDSEEWAGLTQNITNADSVLVATDGTEELAIAGNDVTCTVNNDMCSHENALKGSIISKSSGQPASHDDCTTGGVPGAAKQRNQNHFPKDVVACGQSTVDGLDDLLQGITMDQVSELILALDVEPSLGTDSTGVADEVFCSDTANEIDITRSNCECQIRSLAILAREVCRVNSIQIAASECETTVDNSSILSQQSQASTISLDFTDADILVSDKNINLDLLNELSATPPKARRPNSLFQTLPASVTASPSHLIESPSTDSACNSAAKTEVASSQSPVVVPVTMYWNTFPALLLDGVKYVRLIDISRQALPSKETGLLKKRAQTLGYEVTNCTDLQRNLLVRYAYACQSRSTLMVNEAGAAKVIASYMEKSEIEELSKAPDLPSQQLPANVTSTTTTSIRAPAEPVTLMPQVLIEHKPLQQSSNTNGKKTPSTSHDPVAPERSSRLRQIKSSYRRFLSLGSTPSTPNPNSTAANGADFGSCSTIEENASDRGYHSDQSPDSLNEKPLRAKKSKKGGNGKAVNKVKKSSARRSLSTSQAASALAITDQCVDKLEVKLTDVVKLEPIVTIDTEGKSVVVEDEVELPIPTTPLSPSASIATTASTVGGLSPSVESSDGDIHNSQVENPLPEPLLKVGTKSELVHIRHIDLVARRSGTSCSQDGDLYLQFFKSLHSPCIQCCTCAQFYTLKAFTKHQHINRKLVPVKVRQRIESRGVSVDSESWQTFKRQKQLFETTRSPLKKLSDTRLTKPDTTPMNGQINNTPTGIKHTTSELGKRIPKQKKCNPDEVYYTNPCILNTTRKRKAETSVNVEWKRKPSGNLLALKKRVDR